METAGNTVNEIVPARQSDVPGLALVLAVVPIERRRRAPSRGVWRNHPGEVEPFFQHRQT
ncbi:Uncharacterised protein [Mycobacteroides abscessus subsp. abscessus]|nr:Uncharacterised protein [Mycobacteroides abscessus subsp. abscessus]SIH00912.1 Uncharacterised protein [Mycobacteroides abscessus subsp. abscessus]SIH07663.1 Uncharacterised protein [Mycobacteroides abscessus subsp. abscessus]SIH57863.1 Uncharacterised protein [Mycobacteroides abscessus subsp. abscessus]